MLLYSCPQLVLLPCCDQLIPLTASGLCDSVAECIAVKPGKTKVSPGTLGQSSVQNSRCDRSFILRHPSIHPSTTHYLKVHTPIHPLISYPPMHPPTLTHPSFHSHPPTNHLLIHPAFHPLHTDLPIHPLSIDPPPMYTHSFILIHSPVHPHTYSATATHHLHPIHTCHHSHPTLTRPLSHPPTYSSIHAPKNASTH